MKYRAGSLLSLFLCSIRNQHLIPIAATSVLRRSSLFLYIFPSFFLPFSHSFSVSVFLFLSLLSLSPPCQRAARLLLVARPPPAANWRARSRFTRARATITRVHGGIYTSAPSRNRPTERTNERRRAYLREREYTRYERKLSPRRETAHEGRTRWYTLEPRRENARGEAGTGTVTRPEKTRWYTGPINNRPKRII